MDYSPLIGQVMKIWWLLPIVILGALLKSAWFKGKLGEALVKSTAWYRLPKETYTPFHDVTLRTADDTTQIDHVFVSAFGVFVVETKHMKGWIFGSERQANWTQKIFKKTFQFQNPLRQNYKHAKAIEELLEVPEGSVKSLIVFTGDSTFKTEMPANVTHAGGFIRYIESFSEPVLQQDQVEDAAARIRSGRLERGFKTNREHVRNLKKRGDPPSGRACPKCGNQMVIRTVKKGEKAGSRFWGCSGFPKCRTTQTIS